MDDTDATIRRARLAAAACALLGASLTSGPARADVAPPTPAMLEAQRCTVESEWRLNTVCMPYEYPAGWAAPTAPWAELGFERRCVNPRGAPGTVREIWCRSDRAEDGGRYQVPTPSRPTRITPEMVRDGTATLTYAQMAARANGGGGGGGAPAQPATRVARSGCSVAAATGARGDGPASGVRWIALLAGLLVACARASARPSPSRPCAR